MKNKVLTFLCTTLISFTGCNDSKPKQNTNKSKNSTTVSSNEFVNQLENLGYFKYTDSIALEDLKKTFIKYFNTESLLISSFNDSTDVPTDYRLYYCDGETVFEQGGIKEQLEELSPTFEKLGVKMIISDFNESWNSENQSINVSITVNETTYTIFEEFKGSYAWGLAVYRLTEMINSELQKQNTNERIYLISGGNEGAMVFLTSELYEYIYKVSSKHDENPLELKEWAELMNIKN